MTRQTATNHADPQLCRQCGGRCCQGHPGVWVDPERFMVLFGLNRPAAPEDWQPVLSEFQIELREIDGVLIPAPEGTPNGCTQLESSGCRLDEDRRPCQCLALTPSVDTLLDDQIHCHLPPEGSTATARLRWRKFWGNS